MDARDEEIATLKARIAVLEAFKARFNAATAVSVQGVDKDTAVCAICLCRTKVTHAPDCASLRMGKAVDG